MEGVSSSHNCMFLKEMLLGHAERVIRRDRMPEREDGERERAKGREGGVKEKAQRVGI